MSAGSGSASRVRARRRARSASHRGCEQILQRWSSVRLRPSRRRTAITRHSFSASRAAVARRKRSAAAAMLTTIYHMLKDGTQFQDLGAHHFDRCPPRPRPDIWSPNSPNSDTRSSFSPWPRQPDVRRENSSRARPSGGTLPVIGDQRPGLAPILSIDAVPMRPRPTSGRPTHQTRIHRPASAPGRGSLMSAARLNSRALTVRGTLPQI